MKKTFAQSLRNKEIQTNEQAQIELQRQVELWKMGMGVESEIFTYLGFTYPEFCLVSVNTDKIIDLYEAGEILVDISEDQLNSLYVEWCQIPSPRHERFGQYVYNQVKFEKDNSYNERDPEVAYQILLGACTPE